MRSTCRAALFQRYCVRRRIWFRRPGRCPFKLGFGKWTPKLFATSFCSVPCHCSAPPSPGLWIMLFSPQSLLRSGRSLFSAPQHPGPALTREMPDASCSCRRRQGGGGKTKSPAQSAFCERGSSPIGMTHRRNRGPGTSPIWGKMV